MWRFVSSRISTAVATLCNSAETRWLTEPGSLIGYWQATLIITTLRSIVTGGKKKHVPFRRQRLVLDSTLPQSDTSAPPVAVRDDPFVADLLRVADSRIAELEQQLDIIRDRNTSLEGKMATYSRQVREAAFICLSACPGTGLCWLADLHEAEHRASYLLLSEPQLMRVQQPKLKTIIWGWLDQALQWPEL